MEARSKTHLQAVGKRRDALNLQADSGLEKGRRLGHLDHRLGVAPGRDLEGHLPVHEVLGVGGGHAPWMPVPVRLPLPILE